MGPLGWQEGIFIFVLALLIFGPKKLPELGRTIGKAMTEFRRASSELKSTWDREMSAMERENQDLKDVARDVNNQIQSSQYPDSGYYDSDPYGESYNNGESSSSTVSASAPEGAESTASAQTTEAPAVAPAPAESPASTNGSATAAPGTAVAEDRNPPPENGAART